MPFKASKPNVSYLSGLLPIGLFTPSNLNQEKAQVLLLNRCVYIDLHITKTSIILLCPNPNLL